MLIERSLHVRGYHSTRRKPDRQIVDTTIVPLYQLLLDEEKKHANDKEGLRASSDKLMHILAERGSTYDELIFSL
ncbi:MAG: PAS/PAC sensor protein [Rhodospirillaceae bacterium]|nr:MAG: PAS/PAC sensor protein [Rhodospirillaceae bacterium]